MRTVRFADGSTRGARIVLSSVDRAAIDCACPRPPRKRPLAMT